MKSLRRLLVVFTIMLLWLCVFGCTGKTQSLINLRADAAIPLHIGIRVPPGEQLIQTQEDTDARYKQIADAGVNTVFGLDDSDPERLSRVLAACEKYGLSYVVALPVPSTGGWDMNEIMELVNRTKNHPAVYAYNLTDEPSSLLFDDMAALREVVDAVLPAGKFSFANLLPAYADETRLHGNQSGYFTAPDSYLLYIRDYLAKVQPKLLSFGHFPFGSDRENDINTLYRYLYNLSVIRNESSLSGTPFWGTLQTIGWENLRVPEIGELRWLANTHIAFGAKGLSHNLYWDMYGDPETAQEVTFGMLSFAGETTDIYLRAGALAAELQAYDRAFMPFDNFGVLVHNIPEAYTRGLDTSLVLDTYAALQSIDCRGSLLIGCMDYKGQPGLYVVNFDYLTATEATFYFKDRVRFELWGSEGMEKSCLGETASFALRAGEAKFIVFEKP